MKIKTVKKIVKWSMTLVLLVFIVGYPIFYYVTREYSRMSTSSEYSIGIPAVNCLDAFGMLDLAALIVIFTYFICVKILKIYEWANKSD